LFLKRTLLALIAGLITMLAVTEMQVAFADSDEGGTEGAPTETLTLLPGDNFVGWVAEPIAVDEIFEAIPAASLIYRWDADTRRWYYAIPGVGGNLETLKPGMAAKIRIDGRKAVQWERPLTPAKGMVTLYSGENWVAWNGRDEWPLDQVARGIGKSLVSIEVRGIAYQPDSDISEAIGPLAGDTTIRRGDALRVTVNRDLRWLQPTGMMPRIVWVGDISESLQEEITADIQHIRDYFADSFAIETDFADTTILVWSGVDAAVEHSESGQDPQFDLAGDALRTKLTQDAGGAGMPYGLYVAACWWDPPCPLPRGEHERGRDLTAHEWFHYLQLQIAARHWWTVSPEWMLEGTAIWGGDRGLRVADGITTIAGDSQWRKREASRTSATLRSAEERNAPWQYWLGTLAVELLIERSGPDAPIEYFRQLHPQAVGAERRWVNNPYWLEAFRGAFGIDADTFYEEFAAWRSELPVLPGVTTAEPRLQGSLRHSNGTPASGFWINAAAYEGEHKAGRIRRNDVRADGTFAIDLEADTLQRVWVTRDGCQLWLTDNGLTTIHPQPGQYHDLDTRDLPSLNLTLPEGACENELRARVISLRGDDRQVLTLLSGSESATWGTGDRYGRLSAFVSAPGQYRLLVRVGGCDLWYRSDRLVATDDEAQLVDLSDDPVSIEIRIPPDLCVLSVSGRLLRADGSPMGHIRLTAQGGRNLFSGSDADVHGNFNIKVPASGDFTLGAWIDGCNVRYRASGATTDWSQSTPITVADEDVTGIEFVVPNDPASLCR